MRNLLRKLSVVPTSVGSVDVTFPGLRENLPAAVDAVEAGLRHLRDEDVMALVGNTAKVQAQAHALHLAAVAELEARNIAQSVGALDTKNLLRATLNLSPSLAAEQTRMAVALSGPAADTGQALAEGRIHGEQAKVTVEILNGLPAKATLEDHAFAQKVLLEAAEQVDAKRLRKLKRSLHDAIDPDGPEPTEVRKACAAHVRDNGDGTETLTWTDSVDAMGMLRAVIERRVTAWIVLRFVAGLATGWLLPFVSGWALERLAPLRRPLLNATLFAGYGVGIATAGAVCIALMRVQASSAQAWLSLGVLTLAVTAVVWPRFGDRDVASRERRPAPGGRRGWDADAARLVACYGAFGFGYIVPATFLPVMARQAIDDPSVFGWAWPVFGVTAAASTFAAAGLSRSLGNRTFGSVLSIFFELPRK